MQSHLRKLRVQLRSVEVVYSWPLIEVVLNA